MAKPSWQQNKKKQILSNLPEEILQKIMAGLSFADEIRLRCVCKHFQCLPFQEIINKLPWMLTVDRYRSPNPSQLVFKLLDPIRHKPYTSDEESLDEDQIIKFATAKHGWVLLTKQKRDSSKTSFLLFSPFAGQSVTLPDFCPGGDRRRGQKLKVAFSSDPTSKDCVFVVLSRYFAGIYKHGSNWWRLYPSDLPSESLVFFNGELYLVHEAGVGVSKYDVENPQSTSVAIRYRRLHNYSQYHLVESHRELLLVCMDTRVGKCCIYKYDNERSFFPEISLDNQTVFIGRYNSVLVYGVERMKHAENKVFYYDSYEDRSKFYCLIDGKSYGCEGTEFESSLSEFVCKTNGLILQPPLSSTFRFK